MAAPKGETGSLQPWYKRRASARGMSARSILFPLSFVLIALSLALFLVVDVTAPAVVDMALFSVRNGGLSYNGDNPVLILGTFGYCINWTPSDTESTDLTTQLPICYRGNDYTTGNINQFFKRHDAYIPFGYIARLTPALMALHPLITVLVFLVLITAALPCFIPLVFAIVLSWLATASSIAALGCTFSLAMITRSSVLIRSWFGYGTAIWALLVGAISIWVFTALLTTAWWLRRRSTERNSGESASEPGSVHHVPDIDASVEPQAIEVPGETALKELPQEHAHSHELFDKDTREQGRAESGAEERYELGTPERSKLQA
ncbi:hypothetical protein GGR58DRAFT_199877 [Xylaria digitata]|nr:hypothetical protein GGR58DRAFT_199877 [Xylaria digitata]